MHIYYRAVVDYVHANVVSTNFETFARETPFVKYDPFVSVCMVCFGLLMKSRFAPVRVLRSRNPRWERD